MNTRTDFVWLSM